jgi:hypothetical protein
MNERLSQRHANPKANKTLETPPVFGRAAHEKIKIARVARGRMKTESPSTDHQVVNFVGFQQLDKVSQISSP